MSEPRPPKSTCGKRDRLKHKRQVAHQCFSGMRSHIAVETGPGLVFTVCSKSGNVNDLVVNKSLQHGQKADVFADGGYPGAHKRPDAKENVNMHRVLRPGLRKLIDEAAPPMAALTEQVEHVQGSSPNKFEHPVRVIKCQVGHLNVCDRTLTNNVAQLQTQFALVNLGRVRRRLIGSLS